MDERAYACNPEAEDTTIGDTYIAQGVLYGRKAHFCDRGH
jgi:hypothetical protein